MEDEKKVLGILAIVFGGIALVGSWVPILNNVSFFIAIVALILGVIALIVNRKNKKVLAIVGTCLSIASIIIVLATQSMYSSALDNASKAIDETSSSTTEQASSSSSQSTYNVGDTITFEDEAQFTITGAEWTDERNQFDDTNPEKVLKVTYNVTNLSDDDYVLGSDLELYVNGQKMEDYPNGGTFDTISTGRSYEGAVQYFGVNGSGDMEIEVSPAFSFTSDKAIVKLDIK